MDEQLMDRLWLPRYSLAQPRAGFGVYWGDPSARLHGGYPNAAEYDRIYADSCVRPACPPAVTSALIIDVQSQL